MGTRIVDKIGVSHRPLPTKTSRLAIQLTGRSWDFWRSCLHVFFIRFVYVLFRKIFVVVIRLLVSRSLIFLSHRVFISSSEWLSPRMILSHRRTHIRWADSDISICKRRVFPFLAARVRGFILCWSCGSSFDVFRQLIPRMSPMLIRGHGLS